MPPKTAQQLVIEEVQESSAIAESLDMGLALVMAARDVLRAWTEMRDSEMRDAMHDLAHVIEFARGQVRRAGILGGD